MKHSRKRPLESGKSSREKWTTSFFYSNFSIGELLKSLKMLDKDGKHMKSLLVGLSFLEAAPFKPAEQLLQENYAELYFLIGVASFNLSGKQMLPANFMSSLDYFDKAIELKRNYYLAYLYRALEYTRQYDFAKATQDLDLARGYKTEESDEMFFQLVDAQFKIRNAEYDEAIQILESVITNHPRCYEAVFYRGLAHYNKSMTLYYQGEKDFEALFSKVQSYHDVKKFINNSPSHILKPIAKKILGMIDPTLAPYYAPDLSAWLNLPQVYAHELIDIKTSSSTSSSSLAFSI